MPTPTVHTEAEFVVRESRVLNALITIAFGFIFIALVFNFLGWLALLIFGPPLLVFLLRRKSGGTVFRINTHGLYYYGKLVTDWDHFVSARVVEEEATGKFSDSFHLYVQYTREDGNVYKRRFPLTNTQDKAEEEIIAAIRRFSTPPPAPPGAGGEPWA
ncbi:hypothetical protein [Flaviaesturariibacter amylovorans]|uniref:DUF2244 domain-containing protein n=1 Tax=Flaviaesturariibacter amylovorans TaxID=1084520 RepID=A0ABP8HU60_9BACT